MKNRLIIIIGLDGVPFELLDDLSQKGIMPNTKKLIQEGIFKKMKSSIPEISSVAWSSIITGKNPAEHGIFGFTDLYLNTYKLKFPNFNDLKSSPFWNSVKGKSIIINVPSTYPVKEMNGVHISGFISLKLEKSVYPESLASKLTELDYRFDVDSEKAHKSLELFFSDLNKTLKARIQAYRYLWELEDWQVFMLVFTGTDRLMHFLWDAYENINNKYHTDFLEHFKKIDEVIGEISAKINKEDLLVILSDHGFEKLSKDIYINYFLKKEGFLQFQESPTMTLQRIDYSTKAFALDPARIYINLKNKFPHGSVDVKNRERILKDLQALFSSLEIDNEKIIRNIYRKEEIYSGPFLDEAPDLILLGNQGFNLRGSINPANLTDRSIFTGKHAQRNAFLLLRGNLDKDIIPGEPTVYDVRGIIGNNTLTCR